MAKKKYIQRYPLVWQKDDFYLEIFCSIPNIATGILLTTDKAHFVIDPGDGILRDLNKNLERDEILNISDIFVTHGHHDHMGGLWTLLTYFTVMKKKTPLNIYYPKGCVEVDTIYKAFMGVYSHELNFEIKLNAITEEKSFRRKSISIKPFFVDHRELSDNGKSTIAIPSLGFKFTYDKKSICYGGDTAYCESLKLNSKNADLAIIEAGATDEEESVLHMNKTQAMNIGETAKDYFLVHVPE